MDGSSFVWSPSAVSGTAPVPTLLERGKKTAVLVVDQTWDDLFGQPIAASGASGELVAGYAQRPLDAWLEDEMTLVWVG